MPYELKQTIFIDYGCGKGRALFVAEQCGFVNLIGVDIASELIEDANTNLISYKKKNPNSSIEFIFSDATQYQIPDNTCVFYFFNPFGAEILKQVIERIKKSITQNPRTIFCIYLNPKYKEVFYDNGFKTYYTEKNNKYLEGIIYTY